ncbi:hypothetical protein ACFYWP_37110 [Actinacidiphila glaucinigra]|uniref:hypothetical protein n=1 Tax=Actinacidiphila glaucinigra TaxID=235986 RepID=UPI0036B6F790
MNTAEALFAVEGGACGPYAASPVPATWGPYDPISVTRETAAQIAADLNTHDAGCGLTAAWDGPNLVFTWNRRYNGTEGTETVTPDAGGRYLVGGLWPWMYATVGLQATCALEKWGISAHHDDDAGNTWLVIGRNQDADGFPEMNEPYIVFYLYDDATDEITVERPVWPMDDPHGILRVIVGDGSGSEWQLMERPAAQLDQCVEAIAEWCTDPFLTSGAMLLAELAEYGITATSWIGMSYAIPVDLSTPEEEIYDHPHLSVADRNPSVDHLPVAHTGWTVFEHDANGEPIGDPLYITGNGEPVDCATDSKKCAAFIADWLISPKR